MTIDNHKILPGSARLYPAIGGGWAIKMNIRGGGELLFGQYPDKVVADRLLFLANAATKDTTIEQLETKAKEVNHVSARNDHAA